MKVLVVGIIVLALAVAGVSTYLIQTFSGEQNIEELQKEAQKPKIRVLIASKELRPGHKLGPDNMQWQFWVDESLNPQYIVVEKDEEESGKMEEFTGSVVREFIRVGEPIIGSKVFKSDTAGFLAGVLKSGMRAVSFTVGATTGSAGFILPGDRVDVLLTHDQVQKAIKSTRKGKKGNKESGEQLVVLKSTTETIVRNVRVLAVNTLLDVVEGNNVPARNVTLELTPKHAEVLITARAMGKLSVVLRSLETPEGESEKLTYTNDVEVSPFIQNINRILAAKQKARQKQIQDEAAEQERADQEAADLERAEAGAADKSSSAPPKPRKKKKPVRIFWGGKGTFEDVKPGPKKAQAAPEEVKAESK